MQYKSGLLLAEESNHSRHVQSITEHRGRGRQTQSSTECSIQYTTRSFSVNSEFVFFSSLAGTVSLISMPHADFTILPVTLDPSESLQFSAVGLNFSGELRSVWRPVSLLHCTVEVWIEVRGGWNCRLRRLQRWQLSVQLTVRLWSSSRWCQGWQNGRREPKCTTQNQSWNRQRIGLFPEQSSIPGNQSTANKTREE